MEGNQWAKLAAIAAMVLGSLFILTPTAIDIAQGPDQASVDNANQKPKKPKGPDTRVLFDAPGGADAAALAKQLGARIDAAGVPVDRVAVDDQNRVEVLLGAGGRRDVVEPLAVVAGDAKLWTMSAVLPDVAAPIGVEANWAQLQAFSGKPTLPGSAPVDGVGLTFTEANGEFTVLAAPGSAGPYVVSLDGVARGVIVPAAADLLGPMQLLPLDEDYATATAHHKGAGVHAGFSAPLADGIRAAMYPLDAPLTPYHEPEAVEVVETHAEQAPTIESRLPAWFVSILPTAKMTLGLDLQGGVDMTLSVELDEAVAGQVGRDASVLRDQAKREGLEIASVTRDRVDPKFRIDPGAVPSGEVRTWVSQKFSAYEYINDEVVDGKSVMVFQMKEAEQKNVQDTATKQVLETLRKRIDATGVKEPSIVQKGVGRIGVQLPGKVDLQSAIDAIGTTALLEFHLVDETFSATQLEAALTAAQKALPDDQYQDDATLNTWVHDAKLLTDDQILAWEYAEDGEKGRTIPMVLHADAILTGDDIGNAGVGFDPKTDAPHVSMEFKSRGAATFCTVTGENVGKRFAIVLDDQIKSAPNITERICGGSASISMGGNSDRAETLKDANSLSLVLRTGSLNAPVSIGEVREVGSTLGQDAIKTGAGAALLGSSFVFLFMAIWYRMSGLVANFTLVVNILMVGACMALFGATLTLPGIAGLALTVGMAVDANIIIYERIREELRTGVNARKAVDAGFEKAFVAIFDSNVTTAIAGVVLFSYGSGPIKGFAVTLTIGIITTLITAMFVSRTLMELLTRNSTTRLSI